MMLAYFIRHGQTAFSLERRITGQSVEAPLAEEGVLQAIKAARELPEDYTRVYSSDSLRCRQTAEILAKGKTIPVIYDSRLRERSFGSLEGKLWSEIDPTGEMERADKQKQEYDYRVYGGESVEDVVKRLEDWIRDAGSQSGKPLVVTSSGIIRFLKSRLHGEIHAHIEYCFIYEFSLPSTLS